MGRLILVHFNVNNNNGHLRVPENISGWFPLAVAMDNGVESLRVNCPTDAVGVLQLKVIAGHFRKSDAQDR